MSISISSNSQIIYDNQEYRCPKCSLIPFITVLTNENKIFMEIKCTNDHKYFKSFDEMKKMCKTNKISNYQCFLCENENEENKNIFYYCSNCFKFFCLKHGKIHSLKENHKIIFNNNFDNICFEHEKNSVVGYCEKHNKNYCIRCEHFKENERKIDDELKNEEIETFENEMKKNEEIIKKMEILFKNYMNVLKELENNFYLYVENLKKKINFVNEIINFYKIKKVECDVNYQMKSNIKNNLFDLDEMKEKINLNLNEQMKKIENLKKLLKTNENFYFKNFKIENVNNIKTLNKNEGWIYCIKVLNDGRLIASDSKSNLIIYNKETFDAEIVIKNFLGDLLNFVQLKNKNIVCSFDVENTLKIIKIKNENEYENVQIIKNAHNKNINKIIELNNENLISFSSDFYFKLWKSNNKNEYEKINEIKENYEICDGLEIKEKEILYVLNNNPQSLIFYDLNKNEKKKILNNLNLCFGCLCRIIKLNENEVAIAGNKNVYLIDIKNYLILHKIFSEHRNNCILKLTNFLFLIGDENGNITQYKIENKKIFKESTKINSHKNEIYSLAMLNDFIISGDGDNNDIKIWK